MTYEEFKAKQDEKKRDTQAVLQKRADAAYNDGLWSVAKWNPFKWHIYMWFVRG